MTPKPSKEVTLVELLDRILNKGVVIGGDIFISVAGVELVYIDLRVLIGSMETIERMRGKSALPLLPAKS
ncbi:MAG: gas vesicle protein [Chloroherpetonaceae bacterium]|nr:gas vesicle protein [Chloroherpetonaceae bacterium]MCS7211463.1 gas vesicle protein [Chloroherpetonaceae bacterium]MDW8020257.1 gas vesicle protein [Chloroherpetonaceae bacterium]MDW8464710.1 gas vesicle protein [Chloroherpetonaceae bacterium]